MVKIKTFADFVNESDQIREFNQKVIDNVKEVMGKYELDVADIAKVVDETMSALEKNTNKITDRTLLDALSKTGAGDLSGKIVTEIFN